MIHFLSKPDDNLVRFLAQMNLWFKGFQKSYSLSLCTTAREFLFNSVQPVYILTQMYWITLSLFLFQMKFAYCRQSTSILVSDIRVISPQNDHSYDQGLNFEMNKVLNRTKLIDFEKRNQEWKRIDSFKSEKKHFKI